MRASSLLHEALAGCLDCVHAARVACVFNVVQALLGGGRLSITALGRSIGGSVVHKHNVKLVDRLVGNWQLAVEAPLFFHASACLLLKNARVPLVLVDWTELGPKQAALVAAVPLGGRAIPIYCEVHPESRMSNAAVERRFLRVLKGRIIPADCIPVIVTDAGFRNTWFGVVADLGWHFLGRLSANVTVSLAPGAQRPRSAGWTRVDACFAGASSSPEDLGERIVARTNPITARLIRVKKLPKGRKGSKRANRKGVHPVSSAYQKHQRRAREPWVLVTSLAAKSAAQIVNLYARRMEIEETFRDTKSHRFGWSFEDVATQNLERLRVLLLLACLALLAQLLVGIAGEQQGLHRRYQANTTTSRRVLSFFFLGGLLIADAHDEEVLARLKPDPFAPLIAHVAQYQGSAT